MNTSLLLPEYDTIYYSKFKNEIFLPKLKYDNNQYYNNEKENYEINKEIGQNEEIDKSKKLSFLFPSVPIKVSKYIIFHYLENRIYIN